MPRDPRKVWQHYAQALVQEEDPKKVGYLMRQLYEALAENDDDPKQKLAGSKKRKQ